MFGIYLAMFGTNLFIMGLITILGESVLELVFLGKKVSQIEGIRRPDRSSMWF